MGRTLTDGPHFAWEDPLHLDAWSLRTLLAQFVPLFESRPASALELVLLVGLGEEELGQLRQVAQERLAILRDPVMAVANGLRPSDDVRVVEATLWVPDRGLITIEFQFPGRQGKTFRPGVYLVFRDWTLAPLESVFPPSVIPNS